MSIKTSKIDWKKVAYYLQSSRLIDEIEENELLPQKKILYQFTARGHDFAQIILGLYLSNKNDAASGYYRSRPLLLSLGLSFVDAFAGPMGKSGGFSNGRDIGVVCNLPNQNGAKVLPMSGSVGSQYTPVAGWAQAIQYRYKSLKDESYKKSIAVVLGGDASVATNGFWASLTIATTQKLPMLFYIEDNGYGISVPSEFQTPGSDISKNLASFQNLKILSGDGTEPIEANKLIEESVTYVRSGKGPLLLRLTVPRLSGHSGQDNQSYKSKEFIAQEEANDPFKKFRIFFESEYSKKEWNVIEDKARKAVYDALSEAELRPEPEVENLSSHVFCETKANGLTDFQIQGGLQLENSEFPSSNEKSEPESQRSNMVTAIRRTLDYELSTNPKLAVFGEDVGPKGGVHTATLGLQEKYGSQRVFDTSLSEEGIIGRAVGMALNGLMPVPEIQFRKYADPATEQINDCGTIRWRTANRFAAPIVIRIPGGFFKCGDPWHSMCNEVQWVHSIGWQVLFPSNAEDAVGLLRSAMRSNNPSIFFEHRSLYDGLWARRPYPGDQFIVPIGKSKTIQNGEQLTITTWGAMVERCEQAAKELDYSVEIIDLRSIMPWDKQSIVDSVNRTGRILIVHEDTMTAGFGSEIAAVVAKECFYELDAPVERLTMPDVPSPYNVNLLESVVPTVEKIKNRIINIIEE